MNDNQRRNFLKSSGMFVLSAAMLRTGRAFAGSTVKSRYDLEIELRAVAGTAKIYPGTPTKVVHYQGRVLSGDANALLPMPNSYLGPTIRVKRGQKLRVHFINDLDEPSIIHWHGLHMPADMDGHPRYAVQPGGRYLYEFEIRNRAGTYWYHPHPAGLTATQVYHGLAGLLIIEDTEEQGLDLPVGENDLALVIQDRRFDEANQLMYLANGMAGMMDRMRGFLGDRVLVNGHPDYIETVARRPYRVRLLNASNARIYKLALHNGRPLTVIGTDGGLLSAPVTVPYITLAPAQRVELWLDFSEYPRGELLELRSLAFDSTMRMMGGGMMGGGGMKCGGKMGGGMMQGSMMSGPANGEELSVMRFHVTESIAKPDVTITKTLPAVLSHIPKPRIEEAVNAQHPRKFRLTMQGMMRWGINGREFSMLAVAPDERVKLGTTEVWEFDNTDTAMMAMAHPMHMHNVQFQILSREHGNSQDMSGTDLAEGLLDQGWRDTVLVMPGERVRLLVKFERFAGLYLYHCHNLEHAAMGMMRNYQIT